MRRFISTLSAIVLGLGCFVGTGFAANYSDKSIGISIELDDELVRKPNWRGYQVFRTADNAASVYIKPVYNLSLYHLKEDLKASGFDDVGSIDLVMAGSEKNATVDSGSGVLVPFKGLISDHRVKGVFSAFSGFEDQGFFVIAAARPDYWSEWMPRFQTMLDNIQFIKIDYSEMINNWYNRLSGKSLVPENTAAQGDSQGNSQGNSQGYPSPQPINLCSNGAVADEEPANTQPATPQQQTVWNGFAWVTMPVVQMPRSPARWRIEPISGKPTLLIRQGPRLERFKLEMEGDQLFMSGKPVSITENRLCQ